MKPEHTHPFAWLLAIVVGFAIGWIIAPAVALVVAFLFLLVIGS